jgi:hypothetical protein
MNFGATEGLVGVAEQLLNHLTGTGPWPLVVLVLGLVFGVVTIFLVAFYFLQRGRKSARLKIWIADIDLKGQIEEGPPVRSATSEKRKARSQEEPENPK